MVYSDSKKEESKGGGGIDPNSICNQTDGPESTLWKFNRLTRVHSIGENTLGDRIGCPFLKDFNGFRLSRRSKTETV